MEDCLCTPDIPTDRREDHQCQMKLDTNVVVKLLLLSQVNQDLLVVTGQSVRWQLQLQH